MNKLKLYLILVLMVSLTACSAYDDLVGNDDAVASISVLAESGNKVDVTGEWQSPCDQSFFGDDKIVVTFSGSTVTVESDGYTSTDGSCTGTVTREKDVWYTKSDNTPGLPAAMGADKAILGWRDDFNFDTAAPTSLAGPILTDTPTVSTLSMAWGGSEIWGDYRWLLYVDDTDASNGNLVMYFAETNNTVGTYPDYLIDTPFTKQK